MEVIRIENDVLRVRIRI